MPNENSQKINKLAHKFLKTTSFLLNGECVTKQLPSNECIAELKEKDLPNDSQIKKDCQAISNKYHAFRRLLPANYKDGIYQMNNVALPNPLKISEIASNNGNLKEDDDNNLAFIQWAQFIEHDLVKSVVTTMRKYFFKLF